MFTEHLIIESQIRTLWTMVIHLLIVKDTLIPIMIKMRFMKIMITCSGLISFHKSKRRSNPEIINFVHLKMKIITRITCMTFKIIESIKQSVLAHYLQLMELYMNMIRVIVLVILILVKIKSN